MGVLKPLTFAFCCCSAARGKSKGHGPHLTVVARSGHVHMVQGVLGSLDGYHDRWEHPIDVATNLPDDKLRGMA